MSKRLFHFAFLVVYRFFDRLSARVFLAYHIAFGTDHVALVVVIVRFYNVFNVRSRRILRGYGRAFFYALVVVVVFVFRFGRDARADARNRSAVGTGYGVIEIVQSYIRVLARNESKTAQRRSVQRALLSVFYVVLDSFTL